MEEPSPLFSPKLPFTVTYFYKRAVYKTILLHKMNVKIFLCINIIPVSSGWLVFRGNAKLNNNTFRSTCLHISLNTCAKGAF
jgi:hypothetical protein